MARLRTIKTPKANRVSVIRAHAMLNKSDRGRKARSAPSIPETETISTKQNNKSSEEKHDNKSSSEEKPGNKSEPVILIEDVANAQKLISDAQGGTQEAQDTAIDEAIRKLYPYAPRDGQRSTLRHLIYTRKDLILIAKTSFGKSMILQAISILIRKSITIVILPLNEIGKEQAMYITRIGGRPCLLNTETISKDLLDKLKQQRFTHVLLSPELTVGKHFRDVAIHPTFKQHLCIVVIDEAHLVLQWGKSFRTDYAKLSQLHCLLGADIPWFACSATLDPKTLITLQKGVSFDEDMEIQCTSINRPELLIRTGIISSKCHSKGSALQFIFNKDKKQEAHRIPKTIVFFDSKKEAYTIRQKYYKWLQTNEEFGYSASQTREIIIIFHHDTAEMDKGRYLQELRRLGEDSVIRVIFATEALGVGVNLPDIQHVVQYGLPKSLEPAIFWQRSG